MAEVSDEVLGAVKASVTRDVQSIEHEEDPKRRSRRDESTQEIHQAL